MSNLACIEPAAGLSSMSLALRRLDDASTLLPLDGDKITIGGGQSCTVRISDEGVAPLHCLITQAAEGLAIRRWSGGTLLNGEVFNEAPLALGDRLTIGPIELELVEWRETEPVGEAQNQDEAQHEAVGEAEGDDTPQPAGLESAAADATEASESGDCVTATVVQNPSILSAAARAEHNRQRAQRLVGEVRYARATSVALQSSLHELEGRVATIEAERVGLTDERDRLNQQLADLGHELANFKDELATSRQGFELRERELTDHVAALEQQIADRNAMIEELKQELLRAHGQHTGGLVPPANDNHESAHPPGAEAINQFESGAAPIPVATAATKQLSDDKTPDRESNDTDSAPSTDAEENRVENDLWSTAEPVATEEHSVTDNSSTNDDWATDLWSKEESREPMAAADMWDIEVQSAQAGDDKLEVETTEQLHDAETTVQPIGDAADDCFVSATPTESPEVEPNDSLTKDEVPTKDEEELWGRLSSLRAEASHKLHSEVESTQELLEAKDSSLWDASLTKTETMAAGEATEPTSDEQAATEEHNPADELSQPAKERWDHTNPTTTLHQDETASSNDRINGEIRTDQGDQEELAIATPAVATTALFDPPAVEPPSPAEPVSFVEKYKHLLEEDPIADGGLAAPPIAPAATAIVEPEPMPTGHDDESIEDYMAKMMARLRGGSAESVDPTKPVQADTTAKPFLTRVIPAASNEPPAIPKKPMVSLDEIKASPKPEHSTDMSALRDLANSSARQAISVANSRHAREMALGNLLLSVVTGGSGAYLVWASEGVPGIALFGGGGAVAAAGYWACRILRSIAAPAKRMPKTGGTEEGSDSDQLITVAKVNEEAAVEI